MMMTEAGPGMMMTIAVQVLRLRWGELGRPIRERQWDPCPQARLAERSLLVRTSSRPGGDARAVLAAQPIEKYRFCKVFDYSEARGEGGSLRGVGSLERISKECAGGSEREVCDLGVWDFYSKGGRGRKEGCVACWSEISWGLYLYWGCPSFVVSVFLFFGAVRGFRWLAKVDRSAEGEEGKDGPAWRAETLIYFAVPSVASMSDAI